MLVESGRNTSKENGEKFDWDGTCENWKKLVPNELKLLETWKSGSDEIKVFTSPINFYNKYESPTYNF